ncbi:unnamed protein product, partial [Phaeothamnion confervicola]
MSDDTTLTPWRRRRPCQVVVNAGMLLGGRSASREPFGGAALARASPARPEDGDTEALPREWDTTSHAHFVQVSIDKVTARYTGKANHAADFGTLGANRPLPSRQRYFYFEVAIVSGAATGGGSGTGGGGSAGGGAGATVTIGLISDGFPMTLQPGADTGSYGYRGNDGCCLGPKAGQRDDYGPPFGAGDTVGCGIDFERQEVFFTCNGKNLGTAFGSVSGALFPAVGLHAPGETVRANFAGSASSPFVFDLAEFEAEAQRREAEALARVSLDPGLVRAVVLDYLLHQGYIETLNSLMAESEGEAAALRSTAMTRNGVTGGANTAAVAAAGMPARGAVAANGTGGVASNGASHSIVSLFGGGSGDGGGRSAAGGAIRGSGAPTGGAQTA